MVDINAALVLAQGSASARSLQVRMGEVANVCDEGAASDASSSAHVALDRAIDRAYLSGRRVVAFPPGIYDLRGQRIDPGIGPIAFVGYPGQTTILFDEGTDASPIGLFYYQSPGLRDSISFYGLRFLGTYSASDAQSRGYPPAFLDRYNSIEFNYVDFEKCAYMATDLHFNKSVAWRFCTFTDINRDGARARDCFRTEVIGCKFTRVGDDSVAYHSSSYSGTAYNPDDGSPRREGLISIGNDFTDVCSSHSVLGARSVLIQGNQSRRQRGSFFYCARVSGEGVMPAYSIDVQDNLIQDTALGQTSPAIYITTDTPRGTAASGGIIPGFPDANGDFVMPWDFNNAQSTDAADPIPQLRDINISGNTITRTLPSVANYADWGYGYAGAQTGLNTNPALVPDDQQWKVGIAIDGGARVRVANNNVSHCATGISIALPAIDPASSMTRIQNNIVSDIRDIGIDILSSASGQTADVLLDGNHINCDIYRRNSNSLKTGKYTNNFTTPRGLRLGSFKGAMIRGNIFENVAQLVFSSGSIDDHQWENNIAVCDPVAVGSNANNVGIGNVPAPQDGFRFIIKDCNPQSATWGRVKNICARRSSSIPTTGTYVQGTFVASTAPTVIDRHLLLGWQRLTTGSGHVLGTDWAPVYAGATRKATVFSTFDLPSLAAGARTSVTVPADPGTVVVGDFVDSISFGADLQGLTLTGYVSATDTVVLVFLNDTGSAVDLPNGLYRITILKKDVS